MAYGKTSITELVSLKLHRYGSANPDGRLDWLARRLAFAGWMTLNVAAHPNSRGHRARAAANLWAWQIWRRAVRRPVVVEFACGAKLQCPAWSRIGGAWVSIGYHEEELLFVIDVLKSDEGFIDVGANMGVYSMVAASRGARVLAFEPVSGARAVLEANIVLNQVEGNVQVLGCALSDARGSARITQSLENMNHLVTNGSSDEDCATVDLETLDAVLAKRSEDFPRGISLLKIDAEGFDMNVLRGSVTTLRVHRPAVIVEVWDGLDIRAFLQNLGYSMFHYDAHARSLNPISEEFRGEGYFVAVHGTRIDETRQRVERSGRRDLAPTVRWMAAITTR